MKDYIKETIRFYDNNIKEYIKNTKNLRDTPWLKRFISFLPENAKVLDIGCGFGRDCNFFINHNFQVVGIDLSSEMIKASKELVTNAEFYVMDMLNLRFGNESFDGIWCSATLLHLKKRDASKALSEMRRVLKKNGMLYLNFKEGKDEEKKIDKRYKGASKFYSYYSENEIKDLLLQHKFSLITLKIIDHKRKYDFTRIIYLITKKI